jgi:hypothetical protein
MGLAMTAFQSSPSARMSLDGPGKARGDESDESAPFPRGLDALRRRVCQSTISIVPAFIASLRRSWFSRHQCGSASWARVTRNLPLPPPADAP